jgi:ketosteroid isomerase-like protein
MASAQENAAVVRRGYGFFNSGDLQGLTDVFQEDAVWHVAGRNRLSGEKRGRDAILAYFGQLGELSGGSLRAELHDVLADDDHVVGLHTAIGQREGQSLNLHAVLVFHLRDGKVAEAWEHYGDQQAFDDFIA